MSKKKKIKQIKIWSKKKKKTVKTIYNIVIVLLALVFVGSAAYLINYFWQSKKSEDKVENLRDLIVEDTIEESSAEVSGGDDTTHEKIIEYVDIDGVKVQKKFERLYRRNNDFVGWISIPGTVIDYPVMQSPDNEEYYIDRDFDKDYSAAGTLFVDGDAKLDAHNDNIIMYGHNMKTGKMFHSLLEYEDESFYEKHKYFTFNTIHGNSTYVVIAAFRTKIYAVDYTGFKYYKFFKAANKEEFDNYVNQCKSLTPYNISVTAEYGDDLLTLSTCAYHDADGRYVVVAKKVLD